MVPPHVCSNTAVLPSTIRAIGAGIRFLSGVGVRVLTKISLVSCNVGAVGTLVLAPWAFPHIRIQARLPCILTGRETIHLAVHS